MNATAATPRFQRRKEDRPAEIIHAALDEFAQNGYTATRVSDVAARAGVSKGTLYLYFDTKEELFKAVIREFVEADISRMTELVANSDMSCEAFLRGPFLTLIKALPDSPARVVVRLMVAEGANYPDVTAYHWQNVVAPALATLELLLQRGIDSGEFRRTALVESPQLMIAPVMFAIVFKIVFGAQHNLDIDTMFDTHIDVLLAYLRSPELTRSSS
jgi:AcrR family transcriptional regulator